MNRLYLLAGALALAVFVTAAVQADDKDKKVEIKDVMAAHKKGNLRDKTIAAVKEKKWDEAMTTAKEWVKLADALGKAEPPKGTKESWEKLCASYEKSVKALATAVEKMDEGQAKKVVARINGSCGACHKAHKP